MDLHSTPSNVFTESPQASLNPAWIWTVDDMELQHHFMTSDELCPGDAALWREKVPRLAFGNHCVLHLLLAVSSLHMARQKPHEASRYEAIAAGHYGVGLRQVMDILPNLNRENCGALYIATTLVCSYRFASGPSPGHLLIISDGTEVAWVELLRGVKMVVETMGFEAIFAGALAPMPTEQPPKELPPSEMTERVVLWEPALRKIADLIAVSDDPDTKIYEKMLADLTSCFQQTCGTAKEPRHAIDGKMEIIIGCIYRTQEDFVQCLKDKRPFALLLLAHLVVLIKKLERLWYMAGWASHILHGVALILGPDFSEYLRWPRKEIERLNEEIIHKKQSESTCSTS